MVSLRSRVNLELCRKPAMGMSMAPVSKKNRPRRYQVFPPTRPSKQRMNDSRYRDSGSTHKKGIEAMLRQTWLVTASSRKDPSAANSSHAPRWGAVGAGSSPREGAVRRSCSGSARHPCQADPMHNSTNRAYNMDQL